MSFQTDHDDGLYIIFKKRMNYMRALNIGLKMKIY